ncbi:1-phosphofructokinase family hexose kinase [Ktedonobacter robiniae]|uniref:1-phosphofructokinase n=1 Tax=Ktedonobacter robiniae TaxID=2778365 RepID=A0ABQ3V606_9CHLR|nr:1-phosphofructokinase family hexose kinase [Ktedonobacter robiniae]GHO60027.1 1-phosphofructokinase [Ktedonobacter robiniae]
MIVTVVPNPALDKTIVLPHFSLGRIHRAGEVIIQAGGKGFNVARALHTLGAQGLVIGPVGGYAGKHLLALAREEGLQVDMEEVAAELRTCLTVVDPAADYCLTEIYEQGAPLTRAEWDAVVRRVTSALTQAAFLVISGSFPPGVPEDALLMLLRQARAASVPVFLDTHGAQLPAALAYHPALLKVNQFEAGELLGYPLADSLQALEGAAELQRRGVREVVISLGKAGVVGCTAEGQRFGWTAPAVPALSSTGSGDCLLGGIAAGLMRGQGLIQSARLGVAAGAANTLQIGAGRLYLSDIERLLPVVKAISLGG